MSRAARSGGRLCIRCAALSISSCCGQFAVIQIRRERHEPGGAEAIRHLLDAGIEAPPFLDDQDSGTRSRGGLTKYPDAIVPLLRNSTVSAMPVRILCRRVLHQ